MVSFYSILLESACEGFDLRGFGLRGVGLRGVGLRGCSFEGAWFEGVWGGGCFEFFLGGGGVLVGLRLSLALFSPTWLQVCLWLNLSGVRSCWSTSHNTRMWGSLRKGSLKMAQGISQQSLFLPVDCFVLLPSKFHSGHSGTTKPSQSVASQVFQGQYLVYTCMFLCLYVMVNRYHIFRNC